MKSVLFSLILIQLGFLSMASMSPKETRSPSAIPGRQAPLDISNVTPVLPDDPGLTTQDVEMVMPTHISQTSDIQDVQAQILDHNMKNLMRGTYFKNSKTVQTAQKVQQAMKPRVTMGSSEPGSTQHSIDMEIEAFQNRAKLSYTGWVESEFLIYAEDKSFDIKLYEKLGKDTRLSVDYLSKDEMSRVTLGWDW